LREDPDRARDAGLARNEDAHALAALLDILATELPHLDTMVRRQTTESCRVALGKTMADPPRRRTRIGERGVGHDVDGERGDVSGADDGVSTKPAAIRLTRTGASS
jgi:hypothetical protein